MRRLSAFVVCGAALTASASAGGGEPLPERVLWRAVIDSPFVEPSVATAADGTVYMADNLALRAFGPAGDPLWSQPVGGGAAMISVGADGTIYGGASTVHAFDPDGSVKWSLEAPIALMANGPSIGPNGNIYGAQETTPDGQGGREGLGAFAVSPAGELLWSDLGDPEIPTLLGIAQDVTFLGDRLFTTTRPLRSPAPAIRAWDRDGGQVWYSGSADRALPITSVPRPLGDDLLVGTSGDAHLIAITPDGFEAWRVAHPNGASLVVEPAVGPDGTVYSGDWAGVELWAVSPEGETLWVRPPSGGDLLESIAVSPDGSTLVTTGGGTFGQSGWVGGFDASSGEALWRVTLPSEQGMFPIIQSLRAHFSRDGRTVYVTSRFAGSTVDHSDLWAIAVEGAPSPADLDGDGTVGAGDLGALIAAWGPCDGSCAADLDGDGAVGSADLGVVIASWG